ncbi:MAG TPA: hypothetical protein VMV47_15085 [Bacteroidales bacterium]|nr:hypothetical protein [Bacteroidales bacterium]
MENNKQKILNYAGAVAIALLLTGIVIISVSNSKGRKNLNSEKLKSEKLLSEKLSIEKELGKMQADFSSLKQKNDADQKLLAEINIKIAETEKKINSLTGENRSLRSTMKELEELKKLKSDLENDLAKSKSDSDKMLARNNDLQSELTKKDKEIKNLAQQLENATIYNADNFMVTATRGKKTEKLVICASRAKKLNISFEIPNNLTEAISFKMVTPSGTTINSDDKALSWFMPLDSRNLTASLSSATGEFEQSRQVVLNYSPKTKLLKGEYKIQLLSNGKSIGNCRLMLK